MEPSSVVSTTKKEKIDPLGGIKLEPSNELRFKGPFENECLTVSLSILNQTDKYVAFKIKTTAPTRYCVKPNSGVLEPKKTIKVNVLLQPFNPDPNEKLEHQFMVQYMYLNDEEDKLEAQDILSRWKDVPKSRLLDVKLKSILELQQQFNSSVSTPLPNKVQTLTSSTESQVPTAPSNSDSGFITQSSNESNESKEKQTKTILNQPTTVKSLNSEEDILPFESLKLPSISLENYLNEIRELKAENQKLLKEISRQKEEEIRLKKLALPQKSPQIQNQNFIDENMLLLINNNSVKIIVALIAVIIFLFLFK